MVLLDLFIQYGPWAWFVIGLVLLALELVVPGGWFLWLGAGGILTGLLAFIPGLTWPWQMTIFGVLALLTVFGWTWVSRNRKQTSDRPFLNKRAEAFIGFEGVLNEPISNGFGRLMLGDTVWRIAGPDLPAGARIRVVGADVAVLKVEAI
ncbi:MAG: NfeD family protein [Hyphomicrobiales bacterium]|nr:MAG: NfeD family protein [Hyphomicrobiales bacterium]